jgi:hypothetical protein
MSSISFSADAGEKLLGAATTTPAAASPPNVEQLNATVCRH